MRPSLRRTAHDVMASHTMSSYSNGKGPDWLIVEGSCSLENSVG